ncbi:MAG: branched-chain-amino-acid transaminase [Nitrospirota bacterium]
MFIYLNDRFVLEKDALISVFDHGFLYGDGIFETLRAYNGLIFKPEKHIERFNRSGQSLGLKEIRTGEELITILYSSLNKNRIKDAYIRISMSRGEGKIGLDPDLCRHPTLVVITKEFKGYPESMYEKGVEAAIVNTRRNLPSALNPKIKSTNMINNILAKIEAKALGVYEGIMLNNEGYIAEGTISNIFMVKDETIFTPPVEAGILDGVTRESVISLAGSIGLNVKETQILPADIYDADEAFLTNTTLEIISVVKIDRKMIGDGRPGAITKGLLTAFRRDVSGVFTKSL